MGLGLSVPGDWALTRYGLTPSRGGLTFVDRRRQRMQVFWSESEGWPDVERMFSDYVADRRQREREQGLPTTKFRGFDWADGWRGQHRTQADGAVLTRAVRYDGGTGRLVEVVVSWEEHEPGDAGLVQGFLDRFEVESEAEAARYWRAFEVEVGVPEGWVIRKAEPTPGLAELRFVHRDDSADRDRRRELIVRRMGLADAWLKPRYGGELSKVLWDRNQDTTFEHEGPGHWRGQGVSKPVWRATADEPGPRIKKFIGRARKREDVLWHDDRANAVMQLTLLTPVKMVGTDACETLDDFDARAVRLEAGVAC